MITRAVPHDSEHELVLECIDQAAGYHAIIALHSTRLGPAVGGTRYWSYPSVREATTDALRLSRGMTFKCAVAGLDLGGGKSVILSSPNADRTVLFRAHGRAIQSLGGRYVTGEDVGTTPMDMEIVRQETPYVAGLPSLSGDPSPVTARGVFRAIAAAAQHRWGSDSVAGRTVAVQGCGNVGGSLARLLAQAGASVLVSDIDLDRANAVARDTGGRTVPTDQIYDVAADILAPCALGGILNSNTIPQLSVAIVAGGANNQLAEEADADTLAARNILYVPDFVANAGGVMNGCREVLGWDQAASHRRVDGIFDTVLEVLQTAEREQITPHQAAYQLALRRLQSQ
jgi:leucine dehydrogenase